MSNSAITFGPSSITSNQIIWSEQIAFRNKIINGNFDIWQRGTTQSVSGYGSADRWESFVVGSTTVQSRQSFTLGQTDVPNEPIYFIRRVVTSIADASNASFLQQYIEGVRTFAGKNVTVSFWAKADSNKQISIDFRQYFGAGGSTAVSGIGVQKLDITSSWQKITATISIPSISGKTIADESNSIAFRIWMDAGSSFNAVTNSLGQQSGTFDIAQVQLEAGSIATPFEHRPIGTELALCERYYFKLSGNIALGSGFARTGTQFITTVPHPVQMRISPTVSSNATTGVNYCNLELGSSDWTAMAITKAGGNNSGLNTTSLLCSNGAAMMSVGQGGRAMLNNSVAFVDFNAEL